MKLELYTKRVYGVLRYYPICPISMAIAAIKGLPTLTDSDIERLRKAGCSATVYNEKGELSELPTIKAGG